MALFYMLTPFFDCYSTTSSSIDMAIKLARDMPGPGGNGKLHNSLDDIGGVGKISMSRGKTYIDWEIARSKEVSCYRDLRPTIYSLIVCGNKQPKINRCLVFSDPGAELCHPTLGATRRALREAQPKVRAGQDYCSRQGHAQPT